MVTTAKALVCLFGYNVIQCESVHGSIFIHIRGMCTQPNRLDESIIYMNESINTWGCRIRVTVSGELVSSMMLRRSDTVN